MKKKIVRHVKTKQVKKVLPKKSIKKSSKWQFVIAAVALVMVGYLVFKNAVQKSDINMIAPPAFEPAPCGVKDLQLLDVCNANMFKSSVITCADGSIIKSDPTASCVTVADWYKIASDKCANKCMTTPTPSSSPLGSGCKLVRGSCSEAVCPSGSLCKTVAPSCSSVMVCETSSSTKPSPYLSPAPSGCTYQNVQCIQAPCNPVLVCEVQTSLAPSPVASSIPSIPPSPRPSQLK